jgi:hypothetical protein
LGSPEALQLFIFSSQLIRLSKSGITKMGINFQIRPADIAKSPIVYNSYRYSAANSIRDAGNSTRFGSIVAGKYSFDCSGFVSRILIDSGYQVTKFSTGEVVGSNGELKAGASTWQAKVASSDIKPGNLLYFPDHVGIVVSYDASTGKGIFRSSTTSKGIKDDEFDINLGWKQSASSYKPIVFATRVTAELSDRSDKFGPVDPTKFPTLIASPSLADVSNQNGGQWLNYLATGWESGGDVSAVNSKGALGYYQMMEKKGALTAIGLTDSNGNWLGKTVNGKILAKRSDFLGDKAVQDWAGKNWGQVSNLNPFETPAASGV